MNRKIKFKVFKTKADVVRNNYYAYQSLVRYWKWQIVRDSK